MDLRYTAEQDAFRAEARALARGERARASRCASFDTRGGLRARTARWERTLDAGGWAMVSWPVEYGGRGANLLEWLIFEEEYYRARRAAARQPERHLPARPDAHGVRHARAEGALPAEDGVRARRSGRRAGRSRTPAATWRRSTTTARPRRRPLRAATARRPGPRAAPSPTGCFGLFRTDPDVGAPPAASPSSSCRSTRPASRCGRSRSSTARPASPRSSSTTRACRSRTGSAPEGEGWKVAMATAGFERGLMLRSPARFQDDRARGSSRSTARTSARRRPALRDDGRALLDGRRGLHARHLPHRLAPARRRQDRRRGEPQQDLLVRARPAHARDRRSRSSAPRAELLPEAPAARGVGDWLDGFLFSLVGPDLRRHQRDPAQRRSPSASSACRGSSDALRASPRTQLLLQKTVRDFLAQECTPERGARALGDGDRPLARRCGRSSPSSACPALLVPEAHGGLGLDEIDARAAPRGGRARRAAGAASSRRPRSACRCSRELGARRSPRRWLPRVAAGEAIARGRPSRRSPSSPTRTSPTCCCSPDADGELHARAARRRAAHRAARERSLAAALRASTFDAARRDPRRARASARARCSPPRSTAARSPAPPQLVGVARPADRAGGRLHVAAQAVRPADRLASRR